MDVIIAVKRDGQIQWDIIPEYPLYFKSFCLQIPEKAESLEQLEDLFLFYCEDCNHRFHEDLMHCSIVESQANYFGEDEQWLCDNCYSKRYRPNNHIEMDSSIYDEWFSVS